MINLRTIDVLLRTFDGEALLGARPAAAVGAVGPTPSVGARIEQPAVALLQPILQDVEAAPVNVAGRASGSEPNAYSSSQASMTQRAVAGSIVPGVPNRDDGAAAPRLTTPDASAPLHLSDAALLVAQLVSDGGDSSEQAAIRSTVPLLAAPPLTAAPLAHALSASIANSGLFYESHLAQWTLQQHPQAALANEPQAAWAGGTGGDIATTMRPATADPGTLLGLQVGNTHADAALPLVRHQLHALETHQIAWNGELWPGQDAEIHIAEEEAGDATGATSSWRTHLSLHLPSLGQVDATLSLRGGTLHLQMRTQDTMSAQALRSTRHELVAALEQHSLAVSGFSIGHERVE